MAAGVSVTDPLVACVPLQAPLAVQDVAFVDDQLRVVLEPRVIVAGLAVNVTVGWGVLDLPPQPDIATSNAENPTQSKEQSGKPLSNRLLPQNETPQAAKAVFLPVTCTDIGAVPPPVKGFAFE